MARKVRRPLSSTQSAASKTMSLGLLFTTALISLAIGIGSTYAMMHRPKALPPAAFSPTDDLARVIGDYYYDKKDWANAQTYYLKAIATGQDNPDVHTDLGNTYRFSDQPQEALQEYTIAQKQAPNHENSLFNQAGVYALLHDNAKAIAVWQDYIARFPKGQHVAEAKLLIDELAIHSGKNADSAGKPKVQ